MTVKDLIKILKCYPDDLYVDCNDDHGYYSDIKWLIPQKWTDREGNIHEVLAIVHDGYDANKSIVK